MLSLTQLFTLKMVKTVAVGAGQMSRIDAATFAAEKAKKKVKILKDQSLLQTHSSHSEILSILLLSLV